MAVDIYDGSNEPTCWVASYSGDDGMYFYPIHRLVRTRAEADEALRQRLINEFCEPAMFFDDETLANMDEEWRADAAAARAEAEENARQIQFMTFEGMCDFVKDRGVEISATRLQVGFEKWV